MVEIQRLTRKDAEYPLKLLLTNRPRKPFLNDTPAYTRVEPGIPKELYGFKPIINQIDTSHIAVAGGIDVHYDEKMKKRIRLFLAGFFREFQDTFPFAALSIVSSGTRGVDAEAQLTALAEQIPTVMVSRLGILNPDRQLGNIKVFDQILNSPVQGTALISEHSSLEDEGKWDYDRNRIISWMSRVLLVSGVNRVNSSPMHTASLARKIKQPTFFLKDAVTPSVREQLLHWQAMEIIAPAQMVELLANLPSI